MIGLAIAVGVCVVFFVGYVFGAVMTWRRADRALAAFRWRLNHPSPFEKIDP